jgi:uncharacterized membrane protein YeaQ/YmgE (transglycosylase-associated protein family)
MEISQEKKTMANFVWIVLGLIAGLLASKHFHHAASSLALGLTLGIAGAIAGGLAFEALGFPQPSGSVVAGAIGAAAGAVVTLACYKAIFRPAP